MPSPSSPSTDNADPSTPPDSSSIDTEDPTTPKGPTIVPPEPPKAPPIPSLMPPPSIPRPRPNTTSSLLLPSTSTLAPQNRPRQKVVLAPGHSPLDWARLKSSGTDLRHINTPYLLRIPPSELKRHRRRNDAWIAINGKVYNVTNYLPFHPGGETELLRGVGRDGTKLFMEFHAWVNPDSLLDKCLIGVLVPEPLDEE